MYTPFLKSKDNKDTGNVQYCLPNHKDYGQQNSHSSTAIKIRRDKPNAKEQFDNAFNKLSYDAKTGIQKNNQLPGRSYGFTQLPRDTNSK